MLEDARLCLTLTYWGCNIIVDGSLDVTNAKSAFGPLLAITFQVAEGAVFYKEHGKGYQMNGAKLALNHLFSIGVVTCGLSQPNLGYICLKV